jgi:hypothetical protein
MHRENGQIVFDGKRRYSDFEMFRFGLYCRGTKKDMEEAFKEWHKNSNILECDHPFGICDPKLRPHDGSVCLVCHGIKYAL